MALIAIERTRTAEIVLSRNTVKDVLAKLHGRLSGRHRSINKTLDNVSCTTTCIQGAMSRDDADIVTPVQPAAILKPGAMA